MRVLLVVDDPSEGKQLSTLAGPGFQIVCLPSEALEEKTETAGPFEIAVGPYFPPAWLKAAVRLTHLIVPFAGIPRHTRRVLEGFPQIAVYNLHYNADYTAVHAWALLLAAAKRLLPADRRLRQNDWSYRHAGFPSVVLRGSTLLLLGYGAIGTRLATMGKAFGMRVWAVKRTPAEAPEIDRLGTPSELPDFLPHADAVILSLPDTDETAGMMGRREFAQMKQGAILVNVGRSTAIDEDAFLDALASGRLGASGIDTWWVQPGSKDAIHATAPSGHALAQYENLIFSPHRSSDVAGRALEQRRAVGTLLIRIAEGKAPRQVDRVRWY